MFFFRKSIEDLAEKGVPHLRNSLDKYFNTLLFFNLSNYITYFYKICLPKEMLNNIFFSICSMIKIYLYIVLHKANYS